MAISLIGVGTPVLVSPAAQTMEVPLHASTLNGHYVLCIAGGTDNVSLSTPETNVVKLVELNAQIADRVGAAFGKIADGEPANWTIDLSGGNDKFMRGVAVTLAGVDATTPIDTTSLANAQSNADTHATPAITTTKDGAWVFSSIFGTQTTTGTGTRTQPSGYTKHIDEGSSSYLLVSHIVKTLFGTETPGTWGNMGVTSADSIGITVALRPAGVGLPSFHGANRGIMRGVARGIG